MTPNRETAINLADLNDLISQQNGGKPAVEPSAEVESSSDDDVALDNVALAQNMLKQASGFEAEAKRLRTEAFDLAPELKPKRGRKPKAKSIKTETVK